MLDDNEELIHANWATQLQSFYPWALEVSLLNLEIAQGLLRLRSFSFLAYFLSQVVRSAALFRDNLNLSIKRIKLPN